VIASRSQKIPVTRRDDFFVDSHQHETVKVENERKIKDSN
jgi:hypothetical protein